MRRTGTTRDKALLSSYYITLTKTTEAVLNVLTSYTHLTTKKLQITPVLLIGHAEKLQGRVPRLILHTDLEVWTCLS